MAKAEIGTAKWESARQKSKRRGQLKFYCQMCQKQCRDENGFKCHEQSEGHIRKMQLLAERPDEIIHDLSSQFEHEFMIVLSTQYRSQPVLANRVYQDVIADKDHVHMNATKWVTLTAFSWHLHRLGRAKAQETPDGVYLTYIDKQADAMKERRILEERRTIAREKAKKTEMFNLINQAWETNAQDIIKPEIVDDSLKISGALSLSTTKQKSSKAKQSDSFFHTVKKSQPETAKKITNLHDIIQNEPTSTTNLSNDLKSTSNQPEKKKPINITSQENCIINEKYENETRNNDSTIKLSNNRSDKIINNTLINLNSVLENKNSSKNLNSDSIQEKEIKNTPSQIAEDINLEQTNVSEDNSDNTNIIRRSKHHFLGRNINSTREQKKPEEKVLPCTFIPTNETESFVQAVSEQMKQVSNLKAAVTTMTRLNSVESDEEPSKVTEEKVLTEEELKEQQRIRLMQLLKSRANIITKNSDSEESKNNSPRNLSNQEAEPENYKKLNNDVNMVGSSITLGSATPDTSMIESETKYISSESKDTSELYQRCEVQKFTINKQKLTYDIKSNLKINSVNESETKSEIIEFNKILPENSSKNNNYQTKGSIHISYNELSEKTSDNSVNSEINKNISVKLNDYDETLNISQKLEHRNSRYLNLKRSPAKYSSRYKSSSNKLLESPRNSSRQKNINLRKNYSNSSIESNIIRKRMDSRTKNTYHKEKNSEENLYSIRKRNIINSRQSSINLYSREKLKYQSKHSNRIELSYDFKRNSGSRHDIKHNSYRNISNNTKLNNNSSKRLHKCLESRKRLIRKDSSKIRTKMSNDKTNYSRNRSTKRRKPSISRSLISERKRKR